MPGAMTATTGFIVLVLELERGCSRRCGYLIVLSLPPVIAATIVTLKPRNVRVPNRLDEIRHDIALASRMLAHENVLDAFGHVSMRHPADPGRYLLSRSRSPQLVEPGDILEYTLDSEPVKPPELPMFAERVIHGCLYEARPDVMAVCHHHAAAVLPFCVAGVPIEPVFHLGAATGETTPFWDQQEEFGDTNLLVRTPEEGRSHARALGQPFGPAAEPSRRDGGRRRHPRAGLALHLHVPERGVSVAGAHARQGRQAHARRGQARRARSTRCRT